MQAGNEQSNFPKKIIASEEKATTTRSYLKNKIDNKLILQYF